MRIAQHRFSGIAGPSATANKKLSKLSVARSSGQFATLYRGAWFAHGAPVDQPKSTRAQHAKKLVTRLACGSRPGHVDGAEAVVDSADFEVPDERSACHNGHGGGRGNADEHEDGNETVPRTVSFKSGRDRTPLLSTASLQQARSLPALDSRADTRALREACLQELIALKLWLGTQPDTGLAALVYAWSARWLGIQQAGVTLPMANLELVRAHPSPRRDTASTSSPLDAMRTFNLLAGLLLRQFDRPRTPRQCQEALDTLHLLRHE
ncbi:hypothetical protein [Burkholderia cepacia]|uniref:hypothetical protein n=1 Tax=Burkholderia cepacia TaxID=292 RepID=UPI001588F164|nr:hypothetical protein [Burkholderia cepacia]